MKSTVIALLYPGCIFFEIALALELLAEKFHITFATPDGENHVASNGAILKNCIHYSEVDLKNCQALLVPGGDPGSVKDNQVIEKIITDAINKKIWVGAICAGPFLLAKSGVLKGKRIAHGYGPQELEFLKSFFEGVQLTHEPFVVDGNILTAKPDAHIDFAVELACRLGCADAARENRTKDYYRGILSRKIRPLVLALIRNSKNQFLFHKAFDQIKKEYFYRPLGGGINFGESGKAAIQREIKEELDLEVTVSGLVASFENIFIFDGKPGHEIVLLFSTEFKDQKAYDRAELDIVESGVVINKAVWRSLAEIHREGAKLYPNGIALEIQGQFGDV